MVSAVIAYLLLVLHAAVKLSPPMRVRCLEHEVSLCIQKDHRSHQSGQLTSAGMLVKGRAIVAAAVRLRRPFFSTAPKLGAW